MQDAKGVKIIGADQFLPDAVHRPFGEFLLAQRIFSNGIAKENDSPLSSKTLNKTFSLSNQNPCCKVVV